MALIDSKFLLDKIGYNQKIKSIEKKIRKTVFGHIEDVQAIIIYGSAIQTNYKDYKDIDILIAIKNKIDFREKYRKIIEIKRELNESKIRADLEIYDKKT